MGRKAKFQKSDFIDAALDLLAEQGIGSITIAAIAQKINAPIGSVYHRFTSREILMAELWVKLIESCQTGFIMELESGNGLNAALHTFKWVRKHPRKARVLLLYRREELISGDWPGSIKVRVEELKSEMNSSIALFTGKFFGKITRKNLSRVLYCLVQTPLGAARYYIQQEETIPDYYDQFIRETYQAVMGDHKNGSGLVNNGENL